MREVQSARNSRARRDAEAWEGGQHPPGPAERNDKDGISALKVDMMAQREKGLCVDDRGLKSLCCLEIRCAVKREERELQVEY